MFQYEIKRSKRKSVSISIKNGVVTVHAPNKLPLNLIEDFINSKAAWINKKLAEFNQKYSSMSDIITYKSVLYYGKPHKIVSYSATKKPNIINGELFLSQKNLTNISYTIKNLFKNTALVELKNLIDSISVETGLSYGNFSLTGAENKWGSCDAKNNIMLNCRLIMLEKHLIKYVIIHELCHTKEHNHSKKFWALVSNYLPDYKKSQNKLKDFSILTTLY